MANIGEREIAEVKAEGKHFRLFSEFTMTGFMALVYDMGTKQAILYEMVDDFEDGKQKCEECAKGSLNKPPSIIWTHQP
jgi:hypothetical protein